MQRKEKTIIGLLAPLNVDLTATFNVLRTIGEVRLIAPGQTTMGPIDLMVYPDGMGILPNIGGLHHGDRSFLPSMPINPHFLLFWEENPIEKFTDVEERGIPVLGIGHASAMLYDSLGGNIIIDIEGNFQLLPMSEMEVDIYNRTDSFITAFGKGLVFGATTLGATYSLIREISNKIILSKIQELHIGNTDEDDDGDWQPVSPTVVPPRRGAKNE